MGLSSHHFTGSTTSVPASSQLAFRIVPTIPVCSKAPYSQTTPLCMLVSLDAFCLFSISNSIEHKFRSLLNDHYTVSYEDQLDWFLGMKFDWLHTDSGLKVHVHQEAFILELLSRPKLSDCNRSPKATLFKSGFPVDTIPPSTLSPTPQTTLTPPHQQIMGDLTWLSISIRPDITAAFSTI